MPRALTAVFAALLVTGCTEAPDDPVPDPAPADTRADTTANATPPRRAVVNPSFAAGSWYPEDVDAEADLAAALRRAAADNKLLLVNFGANWCPDCRRLSELLASPGVAPRVAKAFEVVKIDVGNWDRNTAIAERYGNPIENGIPAAVVLQPDGSDQGRVIARTGNGELAVAQSFTPDQVVAFLDAWVSASRGAAGTPGR